MEETKWIVTGESLIDGSQHGPQVVSDYPTPSVLQPLAEEWDNIGEEGNGDYGTNIVLSVEAVRISVE